MLTQENIAVGGELVGIGKIHRDGSQEFRYLDKPIHNKIVSTGLDHLLCYNGNPVDGARFDAGYYGSGGAIPNIYGSFDRAGKHYGIFYYMGIGTDGEPTQFTDTALHQQLGNLTSNPISDARTRCWVETAPHTVSYFAQACYRGETVNEPVTIREFGLFGSINGLISNNGTPVMFCRVALDFPVEIEAGETPIMCYRLKFNMDTSVHSGDIAGLLDVNGQQLKGQWKCLSYRNPINNSVYNFPLYYGNSFTGLKALGGGYPEATSQFNGLPMFYQSSDYNGWLAYNIPLYRASDYAMPADNAVLPSNDFSSTHGGVGDWSFEFLNYTGIGTNDKHRDVKCTLGAMCPPTITTAEGYQDINVIIWKGSIVRFGYDDNGVWVPQAFRKDGAHRLTLVHRTRYSTEDTI